MPPDSPTTERDDVAARSPALKCATNSIARRVTRATLDEVEPLGYGPQVLALPDLRELVP
jgi:hypothetical protein